MLTENQKRLCLSVAEVAEAMGISMPTAYDLTHRADFPALRLGRRVVVPKAAFEKWLDDLVKDGGVEIETESTRRKARAR